MISFSHKFFCICFLLASATAPFLHAAETSSAVNSVVALAPDFSWRQENKIEHLVSLRGKPVLLLIASSPKSHALQQQLNNLKDLYERLAAAHLICAVAFTKEEGRIASNIPFVTTLDGLATARAYDVTGEFAVAVIGPDGNLDCLSIKPLSGQRIYDLMNASYSVQQALRRP